MCILLSWLDRVSEYWICAINVMVTKQVGNLNLVFIGAWIGTHVFFLYFGFHSLYCSVVGVVYSLSLYRYFFFLFLFPSFFFPLKFYHLPDTDTLQFMFSTNHNGCGVWLLALAENFGWNVVHDDWFIFLSLTRSA